MSVSETSKAEEAKEQGNKHYKERQFDESIKCYDRAIELDPNELSYHSNKAAALLECGRFEECVKTVEEAVAQRTEMNKNKAGGASYEKVAKAYTRVASAYMRQNRYDDAIKAYEKALTEDNNRDTRNLLREAERLRDKVAREAYMDPALALKHKEEGNRLFKELNFAAAKAEYDEAIRRDPADAKLYSNRAAALIKLLAYPDAQRDLEKALELDPTFVRAYARLGQLKVSTKEYSKALEYYSKGLKIDPTNAELISGREHTIEKIRESNGSGQIDEDQVKRAMADPEIQSILRDPQMQLILQQMQESPMKSMEYLKDPKIATAIQKLMAAGILRTG